MVKDISIVIVIQCRLINNEMIAEQKLLIERGLHYWHAFHNKPEVNVLCAQMLINLAKLTDIRRLVSFIFDLRMK